MSAGDRLLWRALEWTLIILGGSCLLWSGYAFVRPTLYRLEQQAAADRLATSGVPDRIAAVGSPAANPPVPVIPAPPSPSRGSLIGTLEIPRIGLSELVAEGDDDSTLRAAIGHLPDTPLPWAVGNTALAGHRDALFRPLEHVRVGDTLRMNTARGAFTYRIRRTMIVAPEDVWVLVPDGAARELTLITCYPFTYIGHAPNRFVVKADALPLSASAEGVP